LDRQRSDAQTSAVALGAAAVLAAVALEAWVGAAVLVLLALLLAGL